MTDMSAFSSLPSLNLDNEDLARTPVLQVPSIENLALSEACNQVLRSGMAISALIPLVQIPLPDCTFARTSQWRGRDSSVWRPRPLVLVEPKGCEGHFPLIAYETRCRVVRRLSLGRHSPCMGYARVVIQSFRVWNELEIELGLEFATVE